MTIDFRRGLLWLAPLAVVLGGAPAAAEWHFPIPAGWVDLAGGKPAPPGMPAGEVAQAAACQVYAVDPASADRGYPVGMMVRVVPVPMVVDEAALGPFVTGFAQGVHRTAPNAQLSVVEQGVVDLQGVKALRLIADVQGSRKHLRMLQYALTGGDSTAVVAYSADADSFARYLPVFEANTRSIQGASSPPVLARIGRWLTEKTPLGDLSPNDRVAVFKAVGELGGFVVALVVVAAVRRRRQRSAAS